MRRAVIAVLVLWGASCDTGELNPDLFNNTYYPLGDTLGGDPGPECNTICGRIDACYPNRSDIRNNCRSACPANGGNLASCRNCLQQNSCTDVEAGACNTSCVGMQVLSCYPGWPRGTVPCSTGYGCVCRPTCSVNTSTSSECNSGCCIGNECMPACACTNGQTPTGC
jgi:hypothetical protein